MARPLVNTLLARYFLAPQLPEFCHYRFVRSPSLPCFPAALCPLDASPVPHRSLTAPCPQLPVYQQSKFSDALLREHEVHFMDDDGVEQEANEVSVLDIQDLVDR